MNNDGIPERPLQPPLHIHEMDEAQDTIDKELERIDMEDKYGRYGRLDDKVRACIARAAERLVENAEPRGDDYAVNADDYDELAKLLDDLSTVEKEGW